MRGKLTRRDFSKLAALAPAIGASADEAFESAYSLVDGRWGVQRNEDAPTEIYGRRWRIEGNKLLLTWRRETGLTTAESTITSFTTEQFITEDHDGQKKTYFWAP